MKSQVITAAALVLAASTSATAAPRGTPPIPPGAYRCIAGSSRMMLTLGEMRIDGSHYSFKANGGPSTRGHYEITPAGYSWGGAIGAIAHEQIVESGADATPGDFWFKYKARPTSSPTTAACQKL